MHHYNYLQASFTEYKMSINSSIYILYFNMFQERGFGWCIKGSVV